MKRSTYSRRESFVSLAAMRRLGALCLLVAIGGTLLIDWPRVAAQSSRIITTIAGGGFDVSAPAKQAPVVQPILTARDPQGRGIYIVDYRAGTSLLRFLNTSTNAVTFAGVAIPAGSVGLLAGGGILDPVDGNPLREVDLTLVSGIAADPGGNLVFLAIPGFFRSIYAINISTQNVTFEGRTFRPNLLNSVTSVNLTDFWSLTLTNDRRFIVAGRPATGAPRIYRIGFSEIDAIAGGGNPPVGDNGDNGPATQARIVTPTGTALDSDGSLWIAEGGSARDLGSIRRVGTDNIITTVVSGLEFPLGIVRAPNGDFYVPLGNSQRIIRISSSGGGVTPVAGDTSGSSCTPNSNPTCGDGGPALSAKFSLPGSSSENFWTQLGVDASGIYIADNRFPHVRYVNLSANSVTLAGTTIGPQQINSIVGNGKAEPYDGVQAPFSILRDPHGLTVDTQGNVFIGDTLNFALRYINRGSTPVTMFPGTPSQQVVGPGEITTLNKNVSAGEPIGDQIITASFNSLQGLFATDKGIYISDAQAGIRFPENFDPSSGLLRFLNTSGAPVVIYPNSASPITVAPGDVKIIGGQRPGVVPRPTEIGDGQVATKSIIFPSDVVVDSNGNIYIADYSNGRIRRINGSTGVISSLFTGLSNPTGVAFDSAGRLLVADAYNDRILRQNTAGGNDFTVIANSQTTARAMQRPRDVIAASDGKIYVVNAGGNQILQLDAPTNAAGTTTVVAGSGTLGFSGDDGPAAQATLKLPNPGSESNVVVTANIAFLPDGSLIFTDTDNARIRRVTLTAPVGAFASVPATTFTGQQVAVNSIAAGFGSNLAPDVAIASTVPLPKTLLGTTVTIKDSTNTDRQADLFFVSPGQINYLIPPETTLGAATVTVNSSGGNVSVGTIQVTSLTPGLFSANSSGVGVAAAQSLRVRNGNLIYESTATFNGTAFVPVPINVAVPNEPAFLILYGTGLRANGGLQNVTVTVGNQTFTAAYADAAPGFIGLDQVNIGPLPASMAGSGVVNVKVNITTQSGVVMSNTVTIQIQ